MSTYRVYPELNTVDILENIPFKDIEKYIELKKKETDFETHEFSDKTFVAHLQLDTNDCLDEMWESDVKDWLEWQGYKFNRDDDDDYDYENWEEAAESTSNMDYHEFGLFLKEFMKQKRLYTKEDIVKLINEYF